MTLAWSCRCGAIRGQVKAGRGAGLHAICHCDSCVRAQRHFGVPATRAEGVGVWQTTPDRFTIDEGAAHLALARLSPKGSYRWYAACCDTQIGISARVRWFPFVSLLDTIIDNPEALGAVRAHGFVPQPGGATRSTGTGRMVRGVFGRALGAWISGAWRRTPFYDSTTHAPVAPPELLPRDAGRA